MIKLQGCHTLRELKEFSSFIKSLGNSEQFWFFIKISGKFFLDLE